MISMNLFAQLPRKIARMMLPGHKALQLALTLLPCLLLCLPSCKDSGKSAANGPGWRDYPHEALNARGFEDFCHNFNQQHRLSLQAKLTPLQQKCQELQQQIATADNSAKKNLQAQLDDLQLQLENVQRAVQHGDFFSFKTSAQIPADLKWQYGLDQPLIGDARATKGGTVNFLAYDSFPPTLCGFGANSNTMFRAKLYDEIDMGAVSLHPTSKKTIPQLAEAWAVGPDGRSVFFKLDAKARYSDGVKVRAVDFAQAMYLRMSEYSKDAFSRDYFSQNYLGITIYDDLHWSISLPRPRLFMEFFCSFSPAPGHFYQEFGADFVTRYQWRVPPTTGAYELEQQGFELGRKVALKRVKDWWAAKQRYTQYAFNPDRLVYFFVAEESKALEMFRSAQIDVFLLNRPDLWYEKSDVEQVHKGYIHRATFYNIFPKGPFGIYLNTTKAPFNNLDMRKGFAHAMDMQRVIDSVFRSDASRMNSYSEGFGVFTNNALKAPQFDSRLAREYFAKAGYDKVDAEGYLCDSAKNRLRVELTYSSSSPATDAMVNLLRQQAKLCGLELQLDVLDSAVCFKKVMEKRHQATVWSWATVPPMPSEHQDFHSLFAYDEHGRPKSDTNNITGMADPAMDAATMRQRFASDLQQGIAASHEIQQLVADSYVWVPGYCYDFVRIGYWNWIKWPDSAETKFSHPSCWEPCESYLYWVDEKQKQLTLQAKAQKIPLPEGDFVFDQYRSNTPHDKTDQPSVQP